MKYLRLFVLLAGVPAVLLWLAWEILSLQAQGPDPAGATPAAAAPDPGAVPGPAPDHALARHCLRQALRVADPEFRAARVMLVVVTDRSCGHGCEAERIAERLNDFYTLEGLRVLLIRTATDAGLATPMGVTTVSLPDCASLVEAQGSDYFLRFPDGSVSGYGERRSGTAGDSVPGFDPEPLVRAAVRTGR